MKISPKTILVLFFVNIFFALVCDYLISPYRFFNDLGILWQIPLIIFVVSALALVLSRIAEVAINRPAKKYKVYFWGQVVVTMLIFGLYAWHEIRSAMYQNNQVNIDYNKKFVAETGAGNDSLRLRALGQLETTCKNRNDLRLDFYHSDKRDTVLDNVHDSVLMVDFTYTLKEFPGISLCSKHMIGKSAEELIYYHIPVSEMKAVQKHIGEMDEKISESIADRINDTLDKNEKKLLEDALKRIEERKAQRKAGLHQ